MGIKQDQNVEKGQKSRSQHVHRVANGFNKVFTPSSLLPNKEMISILHRTQNISAQQAIMTKKIRN